MCLPSRALSRLRAQRARDKKARLRQMGVADDILSNCVEKHELEALLAA